MTILKYIMPCNNMQYVPITYNLLFKIETILSDFLVILTTHDYSLWLNDR